MPRFETSAMLGVHPSAAAARKMAERFAPKSVTFHSDLSPEEVKRFMGLFESEHITPEPNMEYAVAQFTETSLTEKRHTRTVHSDGRELTCNCPTFKKKNQRICKHVRQAVAEGWDVSAQPGLPPVRFEIEDKVVLVPIFEDPPLVANVYVSERLDRNGPAAVELLPDWDHVPWDVGGFLMPGEGRAALRDMVLAFLIGMYDDARKIECQSMFHGTIQGGLPRRDPSSKVGICETFNLLVHAVCPVCAKVGGVGEELIPEV